VLEALALHLKVCHARAQRLRAPPPCPPFIATLAQAWRREFALATRAQRLRARRYPR